MPEVIHIKKTTEDSKTRVTREILSTGLSTTESLTLEILHLSKRETSILRPAEDFDLTMRSVERNLMRNS